MGKTRFYNLAVIGSFILVVLSSVAMAEDSLVLGMSTALTGPTAELGLRMRDGVMLGLERVNDAGGIQGRRVVLRAYDDGYEPQRVAQNMRRLVEDDQAVAIIGNVGTPTAIAALPIITSHGVPFVAPFTGAGLLRKTPPQRYVINFRASYVQEVTTMIRGLIEQGGIRPDEIAFFTQRDSYGDAGYVGGVTALQHYGLHDVRNILHVRYERNTLAVENALADLVYSPRNIRAVIMVGAYAPCAKFIRLAKDVGLKAVFLNVSFVGSELLLNELGEQGDGVIVTQVVPPLTGDGVPIVREYLADFKRFNQAGRPNHVGLEGYISTRLLQRALVQIEGRVTREHVVDALESLGSFDLGLGVALQLSPEQHQACQQVWGTYFSHGQTVPFAWETLPKLLKAQRGTP
ncbi:ABC transporter substrate-binding protein [Desulfuromonas acetoxidans]|uniref:ABC transporter substrate-binding protein n=1 Tax=Desulfuromonas acetoxidans TaxID=891 RepID=UPI002931E8E6|nr:ABC transporter substrate-binding protein [Desulfuromonas acetoxidans]